VKDKAIVRTPSSRLKNLPPYVFAVIGQRINEMLAEGLDVIRLDIGSPDTPPPPAVIEALATSAHKPDNHGYSGYKGTPEFREAVARYYQKRFGVSLNPDREVLPLIGSKEGIVNLALAYLDPGDVVLTPDVSYPSYAMGAHMTGAEIYWLPVNAENGFLPDFSPIPADVAKHAKIMWINFPNNPTGATVDLDFYQKAVNFCNDYQILLASDNPYVDVTFGNYRAGSVLQARGAMNCAIEFMSFSKTYNMGGWRLGAAVGNADILKTLLQVKSNMDSGHFQAIYDAGIAAIDETSQEWIDERNQLYERRRNRVMEVLPEIGLHAQCPKGSIYIWGRVQNGNGKQYIEEALNETCVSIAPGAAYGPGGENYVRISVSVPDDRLEIALERLKTWYAKK
jgi:LL-diaminopimelate aminotransferase